MGAAQAPRSVHYSDSRLLRFFFETVRPALDLSAVWPGLEPRGQNRLKGAVCGGCGRTDTYIYRDGTVLCCDHAGSCNYKEGILERLAGGAGVAGGGNGNGRHRLSGEDLERAVTEGARLAGVPMPAAGGVSDEERTRIVEWTQRRKALERIAAWCASELAGPGDQASAARAYLEGRGLDGAAIADLGLGLMTDAERALRESGGAADRAMEAGVRCLSGYIVFPWHDEHGGMLTLYGRWPGADLPLKVEHPGRWKLEGGANVPKTYALPGAGSKTSPLYLDRVRRGWSSGGGAPRTIVLVEGVLDAAVAQALGDTRVCAYVAASLSDAQVETVARVLGRGGAAILCGDPDEAGRSGVESALRRLGGRGVRCYVAPDLPEGEDPDEYARRRGLDGWLAHIGAAEGECVWRARRALGGVTAHSQAQDKDAARERLWEVLRGVGEGVDREAIVGLACGVLGMSKSALRAEMKRAGADGKVVSLRSGAGAPEERAAGVTGAGAAGWTADLVWKTGRTVGLKPVLANVALILERHPAWEGVIGYDQFAYRPAILREPPVEAPWLRGVKYPCLWNDCDDRAATVWLQRKLEYDLDVTTKVVSEGVLVAGASRAFHPVKDYLDSLVWDGTPRVGTWLAEYCGAVAVTEEGGRKGLGDGGGVAGGYVSAVGQRWLVSAVARVMDPGCKMDTVLIFEGEQGIGKSSALAVMGGEWFTDELADLGSKDAAIQLHGAWIVELQELGHFGRQDQDRVKAFFKRFDRYVQKYEKHPSKFLRQCVFGGSVNQGDYLRDHTGARRWWPVKCEGRIDLGRLGSVRDQLWAEAVAMYRSGVAWWLDEREEKVAVVEQEARYETDAWAGVIERFLAERDHVTSDQILGSCLGLDKAKWDQAGKNRVARCLRRLNWDRRQVRSLEGMPELKHWTEGMKKPWIWSRSAPRPEYSAPTVPAILAARQADLADDPSSGW